MFAMSGFVMLLALDRTIIIFGTKKCKELRKNNIAMGLSITVWVSLGRLLKSDFPCPFLLMTACQLLRTFVSELNCIKEPKSVENRHYMRPCTYYIIYI